MLFTDSSSKYMRVIFLDFRPSSSRISHASSSPSPDGSTSVAIAISSQADSAVLMFFRSASVSFFFARFQENTVSSHGRFARSHALYIAARSAGTCLSGGTNSYRWPLTATMQNWVPSNVPFTPPMAFAKFRPADAFSTKIPVKTKYPLDKIYIHGIIYPMNES